MALGLILPTDGAIDLFDSDISNPDLRAQALRRVGAVIEQPAFYPFLSGRENLHGIATFSGLPAGKATNARVELALAQVGLASRAGDAYRKYSLGMKQRLGIAAALLTNPELMILDEPTNGLDPSGMAEVRGLIMQLSQRGITILLSSHLLYEVQQVCTRAAIIREGILLAQGNVKELLGAQNGIIVGFDKPEMLFPAVQALQAANQPWLRGAVYARPELGAWAPPGGWLLQVDAPAERASEINAILNAANLPPAEVRRREPSLETYFLSVVNAALPLVGSVAPVIPNTIPFAPPGSLGAPTGATPAGYAPYPYTSYPLYAPGAPQLASPPPAIGPQTSPTSTTPPTQGGPA